MRLLTGVDRLNINLILLSYNNEIVWSSPQLSEEYMALDPHNDLLLPTKDIKYNGFFFYIRPIPTIKFQTNIEYVLIYVYLQ